MRALQSMDRLRDRLALDLTVERVGRIKQVTGLIIESEGPDAALGELCRIDESGTEGSLFAEVVGFRDNRILLMPLDEMHTVHPGCRVFAHGAGAAIPVGQGVLGRVIDGLGRPLDGKGSLGEESVRDLHRPAPNPLKRQRITEPFGTGIRAIDCFTPMGSGQRLGVFAGSGVGKSTLMGMIARGSEADLNVIALVGERGRELRDFIENDLGPEGLARSVVVVATSDQAAPLRLRSAFLATRIAEHFRGEGRKVMLMMDSLTRFAMAQREIGLAIGEPPASRGYTPSVFSILPRLLERTGMGETGSITALYTVLVEGDDMNEPIADASRGILDGHIVLSRTLASANHYPPIDVLESVSRLTRQVSTGAQLAAASEARDLLALYRRNEDMISIGAYHKGNNQRLDRAVAVQGPLAAFLKQGVEECTPRTEASERLAGIVK